MIFAAESSVSGVSPPSGMKPMTSSTTQIAPVSGANRGDFMWVLLSPYIAPLRISLPTLTAIADSEEPSLVSDPVNIAERERLAFEKLEPGAHGYFAGGA